MKNYSSFIFILTLIPILSFAQIKIGNDTPPNESAIMQIGNLEQDISDNANLGLILPSVILSRAGIALGNGVENPNNGTFIFDVQTQTIRLMQNGAWIDLSNQGNNAKVLQAFSVNNLTNLNNLAINQENKQSQGVVIGDSPTTAKGALVLAGNGAQGFVLPRIFQPHLNVLDPYPGFMCYDTERGTLAIFNGSVWNYWK